jgi:putative hydrolase
VNNLPFGFGDSDDDPDGTNQPGMDPFAALGGADLGQMLQQLGRMMSAGGDGPVNWQLAQETAQQTIKTAGDRPVSPAEHEAATDAVRLAEMWLDPATAFAATATSGVAWSQQDWVNGSMPTWRRVIDPVAERMAAAQVEALPEQVREMAGPLSQMLRQLGSVMLGAQLGQGLAGLAATVLTGREVGLPIGPDHTAVLMPAAIDGFATEHGIPADEARLYQALRETAWMRLFGHVTWLADEMTRRMVAAAETVQVDAESLGDLMGGLDPSDTAAMQRALSGGLLQPEDTPQRRTALARLEALLALTSGWVDAVVAQAAAERLPHAAALSESTLRRRASAESTARTFSELVGLDLNPQRVRQSSALWTELGLRHGLAAREDVWTHPDLLPTSADLDDPAEFVDRVGPVEVPDDLSGLS